MLLMLQYEDTPFIKWGHLVQSLLPLSLLAGMAGTIYFLADLLVPSKARFPAFEL